MTVPQNAPPLRRKLGRKGNTARIRRKNPVDGSWYCGTVITVPYRMIVGAIQESPAAPMPTTKKQQDQPQITTSLRARKGVAISLIPAGDCHVGLCPPRNDVVTFGWSFHTENPKKKTPDIHRQGFQKLLGSSIYVTSTFFSFDWGKFA